jgi:hypothetical protein
MGAKTETGKMTQGLILAVLKRKAGVFMVNKTIRKLVLAEADAKGIAPSVLAEVNPQLRMMKNEPNPAEHGGTLIAVDGKPKPDGKGKTKGGYRFDLAPISMLLTRPSWLQIVVESLKKAADQIEIARREMARMGITSGQPELPLGEAAPDSEPQGHDGRPEGPDA